MKKIALALLLALNVAGCITADQLAQYEADAAAVIAKIRAGAAIVAADVDASIVKTCAALPSISQGIDQVTLLFPARGPKTAKAIVDAGNYLQAANDACLVYDSTPSTTGSKVSILLKLWKAYQAGKASVNAASTAAGQ